MHFLLNFVLIYFCLLVYAQKNVVLIVTDDQDITLGGMTPLSRTMNLIGNKGAIFSNCIVASPICCPNRASILTGRYQHNHFVVNNSISGGCNSIEWQDKQEPNTFAAQLKNKAGYTTFYAGKYLNQYGHKTVGGAGHIPVGWDWWIGLIGNSKYYNYTLSINGTRRKYGNTENDYLTDVIGVFAKQFINQQMFTGDPFLMVVAPPAPHAPFTPALRHYDKYKHIRAKRTPNFNTPLQMNKHWLVRMEPSPLPDDVLKTLDEIYRHRWETLLAVDELVANVFHALKKKHILEDTFIIFTSDNGYHIGQFSLPIDKRQPYETDIRVPLLIRGPGISSSKVAAPVSTVDLFATILDIAGLNHSSDGVSLLKQNLSLDRTLLVEYRGEKSNGIPSSGCPSDSDFNLSICSKEFACKCQDVKNNTYSCIRDISPRQSNIFCIFEDNEKYVEAYDLMKDMYQFNNIGYSMKPTVRRKLRHRLKKMSVCRHSTCILTES